MALPFWGLGADGGAKKNLPGALVGAVGALPRVDSLLAARQYAAATALLRRQVWGQQRASARALLQLAYAQQQLGHYPAALLYLGLAQARQPRLDTWRQQAALAARHRLVGYPTTWQQELRVRAQRYVLPRLAAGCCWGPCWGPWYWGGAGGAPARPPGSATQAIWGWWGA
ncbi:hypothetical protein, partial [Hymenobacter coccineus]|uniref:hypothetical protein n=1 Tax=Hymenobacter coccineus TaxID=1908235 RepID=UPI00114D2DFE